MGLKKKKKTEAVPGRVRDFIKKKLETRSETQPGYDPITLKLQTPPPLYI